jgi:hypothetical protein
MSHLNRFTAVPILFDMIIRKHLVLMDPALWEDRNESELLLEYKKRKKAQKLFAACFSSGGETIHHWKAFAGSADGCCIEFDKERFINHVSRFDGIRCAHVEYKRIKEVDPKHIDVEMIPFTKRWPYQCEEEYRIIWVGRTNLPWHEIPIDLRHIRKITLR